MTSDDGNGNGNGNGGDGDGKGGKLTFCDLAGSEQTKKSGAVGERMVEANNINKSLSALKGVLMAVQRNQRDQRERN